MPPIDDEMLMAYVDGELDEVTSRRVTRALAESPRLAEAAEAQRRLKAKLSQRYDPVAEEEVPDRFRALLESNVVPIGPAREKKQAWLRWPQLAALAATFVVGMLTAQVVTDQERAGVDGGPMLAAGPLVSALETQLASTQPEDAPAKIGVSFAATDGRLCRTFETADLTGLACRAEPGWELVTTARLAGGSGGEYRQAGSAAALVMQVSQDMISGEPFDAEAERRARDSGWRSGGR